MELKKAKSIRDAITKCFAQKQFDEGMKLFEEWEAELPEVVRFECLGNLHFYRHELQEAVRLYESAIKQNPDYLIARYQYIVGTQEEREENFVDAFKRYQSAIEIEPSFVDSYVELGGLLVKVRDYQGAAQCYRDAVRLDPADIANLYNLKSVLDQLIKVDPKKGYQDELKAVEEAYERHPESNKSKSLSDHQW